MICVRSLNKSFKGNRVLKNVSVSFDTPGVIAILGPNGSGKTTLLKCLLGMVIPDDGEILFRGKSIRNEYTYRQEISYLSQIARFPENLTALELIRLMRDIKKQGNSREELFIRMFNLEPELKKKMGSLSGGTRQKVNIMLALMHDEPVIILDEPSTGLDPLSMKRLKEFILDERRRGKLILITTHIIGLAEDLAEDILFMLDGCIYFSGGLHELLEQEREHSLENAIAHILESSKILDCVEYS